MESKITCLAVGLVVVVLLVVFLFLPVVMLALFLLSLRRRFPHAMWEGSNRVVVFNRRRFAATRGGVFRERVVK